MEFTVGNFVQLKKDLVEEQERGRVQRRVLETAIDRLAAIGIITNTPHCKRLYMDGEREL